MPLLLDTSVLVAFLNERDPRHDDARRLLDRAWSGREGVPIVIDLVLTETLTLLRRRPGRVEVTEGFLSLLQPPFGDGPLVVRSTPPSVLEAAVRIHADRYDRGLSSVDCALLAHAEDADAALATFDRGFDGLARLVDARGGDAPRPGRGG